MTARADSEGKLPLYPKKKRRRHRAKQRWPDRDPAQNWRAEQQLSNLAEHAEVASKSSSIGGHSGQITPVPEGVVEQHSSPTVDGSLDDEVSPAVNEHIPVDVVGDGKSGFKKPKASSDQQARDGVRVSSEAAMGSSVAKNHNGGSKPQARSRSRKNRRKSSQVMSPELKDPAPSHNNPDSTTMRTELKDSMTSATPELSPVSTTLELKDPPSSHDNPVSTTVSSPLSPPVDKRDEKTVVIIQSSPPLLEEISEENWMDHFKEFLPDISDVCYFHPEDKDEFHIRVSFHSSSAAVNAVSALNNVHICGIYMLSLQFLELSAVLQESSLHPNRDPSIDVDKDRDCLLKQVRAKKKACLERSKKESAKLKAMYPTQFKEVEEMAENPKQMSNLEIALEESKLRNSTFLRCCNEVLEKLGSAEMLAGQISALCTCFDMEVKHYERGLPIYAHRPAVMEMIDTHQVSIVTGLGSDKSTQLVQYLQEAGYAANGLIVCTQPTELAAISLAEHVSSEGNEEVGNTYGYVAAKSKRGTNTKVLYMTDHALLNECIADPTLSKYSCLVIDEAHERSIHTDILIAFIKRCLPNRQDLKVIISATIRHFSSYFGGPHLCPVIEVPSQTYPVKVKWSNPRGSIVDRDYVSEVVNKVLDIHVAKRGKKGDMLVFLTCPAEIERACQLAKEALKNEATVLPLHGRLQLEDQKKVFLTTERGKRKVVFSTETSVTIPGIVYVVDTGLAKELCYDPEKNINSLELRCISKSSADQRKGMAGTVGPGECYRLFSKAEYTDMRENATPEILRISLGFAVMKLYEFGIEDIHSFEFVDTPDRRALDEAIENLKFLGAIEEGKLTKLGKKMALLPLNPNLSKVLLDAIGKGIGAAASAAVAISTLAGFVSFRSGTAEMKDERSTKKLLPFCQESGDQMTHLHAYFQWYHQGRKKGNRWCVDNNIDAKGMLVVQCMIEELRLTLKQMCDIKIPEKITSLDKADKLLPKLFFDAFMMNMCVQLGHDQVGYWSEKLPGEEMVIHYGSSLHYLSSVPQCVVYEKTQKNSQHFLLQALPVREEWIQEAIESGKLTCHPTDNDLFQFKQVSPVTFTNLGPTLMTRLKEKYPQDRELDIPDFIDFEVQPVFEYAEHDGTLRVFALRQYHEQLQSEIYNFAESVRKELKEESCTFGGCDDVHIVIGSGGCVQHVLMPDNFQTVIVKGVSEILVPKVEKELMQYGECSTNVAYIRKKIWIFCKYSRPADASKALQHKFVTFYQPGVKIVHSKNFEKLYSMKVRWCRRPRKDHATVYFSGNVHTQLADCFRDSGTITSGSGLCFKLMKENEIQISGVHANFTEGEIKQLLLINVPFCKEVDFQIFFFYDKAFQETNESYSKSCSRFCAALAQITRKTSYYVEFEKTMPYPQRTHYTAYIHFEEAALCLKFSQYLRGNHKAEVTSHSEAASDASSDENGSENDDWDDHSECSFFDNLPAPLVELSLASSTRYSAQFFSAIVASVQLVTQKLHHQYKSLPKSATVEYKKQDKWGYVFVNITSNDFQAFANAKKMLAEAVMPEVTAFPDYSTNQYLTTLTFEKAAQEIQEQTTTYIKILDSGSGVAIYGTAERRGRAKESVELHLQKMTRDGIRYFEVNLTKKHCPGLVKYLITKYGSNLSRLPRAFQGISATRLNSKRQILTLFATYRGHKAFLCFLDQQARSLDPLKTGASVCCICLEACITRNNFYQLEYCGHLYCKECIQQQLEATSIDFPATCAADKCEEQLVWRDFDNLFKHKAKELRNITSASLKSYATNNPDKVRTCITPGCKMVYALSERCESFQCTSCKVNICIKCHTMWHEDLKTCQEK